MVSLRLRLRAVASRSVYLDEVFEDYNVLFVRLNCPRPSVGQTAGCALEGRTYGAGYGSKTRTVCHTHSGKFRPTRSRKLK
jgi:hypothetical protein